MFADGPYPLGDFVGGTRQLTFPKDSQEVCVLYEIHIEPTFLGAENNETFDVSFEATGPLGGNRFTATGQSMVTIKDEPPKSKQVTCAWGFFVRQGFWVYCICYMDLK